MKIFDPLFLLSNLLLASSAVSKVVLKTKNVPCFLGEQFTDEFLQEYYCHQYRISWPFTANLIDYEGGGKTRIRILKHVRSSYSPMTKGNCILLGALPKPIFKNLRDCDVFAQTIKNHETKEIFPPVNADYSCEEINKLSLSDITISQRREGQFFQYSCEEETDPYEEEQEEGREDLTTTPLMQKKIEL